MGDGCSNDEENILFFVCTPRILGFFFYEEMRHIFITRRLVYGYSQVQIGAYFCQIFCVNGDVDLQL